MLFRSLLVFGGVVVCRCFASYWLFKPMYARPPGFQHNETLGFIKLSTGAIALAGFFFLAMRGALLLACGLLGLLWVLDQVTRRLCLEHEVRRMLQRSSKSDRAEVVRYLRSRAKSTVFL